MLRTYSVSSLFLAALLMVAAPIFSASAEVEGSLLPLPKQMAYEFAYLNAPIGNLSLNVSEGEALAIDGRIQVAGIAKLFSDFYNTLSLKVQGPQPDGHARIFDTLYHQGDKKQRHIVLNYDGFGALTDAKRTGIYDMARRDAISDADLAKAYDPLSMMVEMRMQVYQAVQSGKKALQLFMYDGKRLYQFDVAIYGMRGFDWNGEEVNVHKIGLTHRIIGGMTAKEKKRKGGYQFPEAVLYFTTDQRFLPVYFKQPWKFGAFKATMQYS